HRDRRPRDPFADGVVVVHRFPSFPMLAGPHPARLHSAARLRRASLRRLAQAAGAFVLAGLRSAFVLCLLDGRLSVWPVTGTLQTRKGAGRSFIRAAITL